MSQRRETISLILFLLLSIVVLVISGFVLSKLIGQPEQQKSDSTSPTDHTIETPSLGKKVPLEKTLTGNPGQIESIAISADGQIIATGSNDGNIQLWNWRKEEPTINPPFKMDGSTRSLAFSLNGNILVSGGLSNDIYIWEIPKEASPRSIKNAHSFLIESLTISPVDGNILASGSDDGTIRLWNLQTGKPIISFGEKHPDIKFLTISPDGKTLASSSSNGTIKLWNLENGEEKLSLKSHSGEVTHLIFKNDEFLVSGSDNGTIKLWNLKTGQLIDSLEGHSRAVTSLDISLDGQKLASGSRDGTVRVWDLVNNKPLQTYSLSDNSKRILPLPFTRMGKSLYLVINLKVLKLG